MSEERPVNTVSPIAEWVGKKSRSNFWCSGKLVGGVVDIYNNRYVAWTVNSDQAHILDTEEESKRWVERHVMLKLPGGDII